MTLRPKRPRPIARRDDWFRPKNLPHFDPPLLSRKEALRVASDPDAVVRHAFLPLISFSKTHRRFTSGADGQAVGRSKVRPLAVCANRDASIFAYYAHLLRDRYEGLLGPLGIDACVVGYRKGSSNIETARDAFAEITARGRSVALALDIDGFFDNIPHAVLKAGWARVLGRAGGDLPDDHYALFKALTQYSKVDRDRCLERLGLARPRDDGLSGLPKPLCSIGDFRRLVRGCKGLPSLVERNRRPWGIPQGTPLSPVAANIAMLGFDATVAAEAARVGAFFRRYSDDVLIVCDPGDTDRLERFVGAALAYQAPGLRLKDEKAQRVQFLGARTRCQSAPLQYLGFTFDGRQILLRASTLARQLRRVATAARWAKARHAMARAGKIEGRPTLHRKSLLTRFTHLGADNFHTGYAARSGRVMGTRAIPRQLRNHMAFLAARLR